MKKVYGFIGDELRWNLWASWDNQDWTIAGDGEEEEGGYNVIHPSEPDFEQQLALWQLNPRLDVARWVPIPTNDYKGGKQYDGGAWIYYRFDQREYPTGEYFG